MENKKLAFIRQKLSKEELLCQLAEEASELAQAALKLRRVFDGTNPTPTTRKEAVRNFSEEISDVALLVYLLGLDNHLARDNEIMNFKLNRWCDRLKERKNEK